MKKILEKFCLGSIFILYIFLVIINIYGLTIADSMMDYFLYCFLLIFITGIPFILLCETVCSYYLIPFRNRSYELWVKRKYDRKSRKNGDILLKLLDEKHIAMIIMEYVGENNGIEVVIS